MQKHIIGIDEAGRGPLAGPVAVGVVAVPAGFDWKLLPGVTDSKKLSEEKRREICTRANRLAREGKLTYKVSLVGASVIDRIGITAAVALGIRRALTRIEKEHTHLPQQATVKLDGLLKAPDTYINQSTIVGGDRKEKVIGLASIVAKVTRDQYMMRKGVRYPEYGFAEHKGYGTALHRAALSAHGPCGLHRNSFCTRIYT